MTLSIILLEYLQTVQHECLQLGKDFASLKKAKSHAKELLPEEPISLVEKYNDGKQPYAKADLVATRHSRFTQPALPVEGSHCDCSGKCSTKRCPCRNSLHKCKSSCGCKKDACTNIPLQNE